MNVYILRKHPPCPYRYDSRNQHIAAFTIDAASTDKAKLDKLAKEKNATATTYFYSVGKLALEEVK